jgi:putative phage-type endonuclease
MSQTIFNIINNLVSENIDLQDLNKIKDIHKHIDCDIHEDEIITIIDLLYNIYEKHEIEEALIDTNFHDDEEVLYTLIEMSFMVKMNKYKPKKELKKHLKNLKKRDIFGEQRSDSWHAARQKMLTSSDWANLLGYKGKAVQNNSILKKCGYVGKPFRGSPATEWGVKYEPMACEIYELMNKCKVEEYGLIQHDYYDFLGASPDGITTDGVMIEIKCPYSRFITGEPSFMYWMQVQGQLEVCNLEKCDFFECNFIQYCEDEYISDDISKYKGCLMEFIKISGGKEYAYSKINDSSDNIEKWATEKKNEMLKNGWYLKYRAYWKLNRVSNYAIYRDYEWFNDIVVDLEGVWSRILQYRKNGYNELIKEKDKESEESINELIGNICSFNDNDDDSSSSSSSSNSEEENKKEKKEKVKKKLTKKVKKSVKIIKDKNTKPSIFNDDESSDSSDSSIDI